jgi:four helix bundle protein
MTNEPIQPSSFSTPPSDLKHRTKQFALRVIRLYAALPKSTEAQVIGKQLLRSGTSVGAHYREGVRSRSTAEFVSKIEGGLQELEESAYWMELLVESSIIPETRLSDLQQEADELMAILVTCSKNAKAKGMKDKGGKMNPKSGGNP